MTTSLKFQEVRCGAKTLDSGTLTTGSQYLCLKQVTREVPLDRRIGLKIPNSFLEFEKWVVGVSTLENLFAQARY